VPDGRAFHKMATVAACAAEATLSVSTVTEETHKAPQVPVTMVMALEEMVTDVTQPTYWRMLAWWRLLKVWGVLRFDDHRGLVPKRMRMSAAGLAATLVRTKTSGAGKKVEELPMFVSSEAFLRQQTWLAVGFDLWGKVSLDRDFFLCLPTSDWMGARLLQAKYADGLAMSRGLTAKLTFRQEEGAALILPAGVERFWSEHSERATLPSWAATLNFPQSWLDNLGRWGARRSAAYVRTGRVRVMVMQSKVADAIRCASDPSTMVGDQGLMDQLSCFLQEKGFSDLTVQRVRAILCQKTSPGSNTTFGNDWEDLLGLTDEELGKVTETMPALTDMDDVDIHEAKDGPVIREVVELPLGSWVVSTRTSGIRCLHKVGECWRKAGRDFSKFQPFNTEPDGSQFDLKCKACFGKQVSAPITSDSGSSSTGEDGQED
jgi:hypothetical protein